MRLLFCDDSSLCQGDRKLKSTSSNWQMTQIIPQRPESDSGEESCSLGVFI